MVVTSTVVLQKRAEVKHVTAIPSPAQTSYPFSAFFRLSPFSRSLDHELLRISNSSQKAVKKPLRRRETAISTVIFNEVRTNLSDVENITS